MARLLIVSNRLPVTVRTEHGDASVVRSPGGLATALTGPHQRGDSLWIGWPGDLSRLSAAQRRTVDAELRAIRAVPVELTATDVHRYYDGFSNGVLWPLFHYLLDKVNLDARPDWEAYQRVNEQFAAAVAERHEPGDTIWVHDYQLMLVPELLRRRLPEARIGFFLHVPFPGAEVFRILPWREQILRGVLGADLVGFHTSGYRRDFCYAAARVLGSDFGDGLVEHDGRRVEVGVHPIGVDAEDLERLGTTDALQAAVRRLREDAGGRRIVLGIDRLDYTKGIPRRLLAIERLLEREPELRDRLRFVQLAVPSREKVGAYAEFRSLVHEMVGRINGRFGHVDAVPIHYLDRALPREDLVALYLAADVMLVTPLRDGMNLVAKEYIAARCEPTGVLVLSEFAGAAAELVEALQVNPYDIDSVAGAVKRALAMPDDEQRLRMGALKAQVTNHDVHRWTRSFRESLDRIHGGRTRETARPEPAKEAIERARRAAALVLILDYDGTLVPLAATPDLAFPDRHLLRLLRRLAERPGTVVAVVSGRKREDLERWLGALPIAIHAEHGYWGRSAGTAAWVPLAVGAEGWKGRVAPVLRDLTQRTAGSFVEEKTVSLGWHYRGCDPELAHERVRALPHQLADLLREEDLELLAGAKVLEVRRRGVHKGRVVPAILASAPGGAAVVAIGDDRTDEDLFTAVPPGALTIRVGAGTTAAAHRLEDVDAVRRFLESFLE